MAKGKTALAFISALVLATPASSTDGPIPCLGNNICTGILHEASGKLWLSNILGIKQSKLIVVINEREQAKVLNVCTSGQYCKIFGQSATDCEVPQCLQLSDVVAVEKNADYFGLTVK
jgi:hypothetical protein